MMKRVSALLVILFSISFLTKAQEDVVLTIGEYKVNLEEFEYIYKKNNRDKAINQDSLDNYIDLFVNFKLKVQEAKSLGLDTNRAFIKELKGYRKQLARPYLTDADLLDGMVRESYDRMINEIRASHILVRCEPNARPSDTLKAFTKIMKLRDKVVAGEDFGTVAKSKGGSEDPSAQQNGGDLGYFSSFQMVYPFETAAYNTKKGEISMPVRTKYGYHILYITDVRKALGEIKVAHIMIKAKHDSLTEDARTKANDIYGQLQVGADFGEMALKYSDDKNSKKNGGEIAWFGTGKMIPEFEAVAFALENNGDIAEPVQTEHGFYIIKRLDYKPVPEFENVKKELKTKISRDARSEVTKDSFISKMKNEYNFVLNKEVVDVFRSAVDTGIYRGIWNFDKSTNLDELFEMEICNIDGKSIPASTFDDNFKKLKIRYRTEEPIVIFERQLKKYIDEAVLDYEDTKLEEKYDDFRLLMNEYRDGMLLFELTDDKVWTKAVKDSTGLKNYYSSHKDDYMWEERADATIYTCINKKVAKKTRKVVKKGMSHVEIESKYNQESSLAFQHKSGLFSKRRNEELGLVDWTEGLSKIVTYNGQYVYVQVDEILPQSQKEFEETRGPVTADFQKYLEEEWVKELRNKYLVTVNKDVLYKLVD